MGFPDIIIGLCLLYIFISIGIACNTEIINTDMSEKVKQSYPSNPNEGNKRSGYLVISFANIEDRPNKHVLNKKFPRMYAVVYTPNDKVAGYTQSIDTAVLFQEELANVNSEKTYITFGPDHIQYTDFLNYEYGVRLINV